MLDPRFGIVTDSQVTGVKMGSQSKIDDVRMIIAGSEPLCDSVSHHNTSVRTSVTPITMDPTCTDRVLG